MDTGMLMIVAMFVLMWVLLIRPQRKRQAEQKAMLSRISPGDEVLTVGGLFGIVQTVEEDDSLVVEIAERVHVRISRRAVASVTKAEDAEAESDEDEDEADEPEAVDDDGQNDAR